MKNKVCLWFAKDNKNELITINNLKSGINTISEYEINDTTTYKDIESCFSNKLILRYSLEYKNAVHLD